MTNRVLLDDVEFDLQEIDRSSRVAILAGTFDPIHMGHLEIANQTLKRNFGESGADLVLLYPHSHSKKKIPAAYGDRLTILKGFLSDQKDLGILVVNESDLARQIDSYSSLKSLSWLSILFRYLVEYRPLSYARILGSDRIDKAIEEHLYIPHYVSPRGKIETALPNNFLLLPQPKYRLSSAALRSGETPFSERYLPYSSIIKRVYPHANFTA